MNPLGQCLHVIDPSQPQSLDPRRAAMKCVWCGEWVTHAKYQLAPMSQSDFSLQTWLAMFPHVTSPTS